METPNHFFVFVTTGLVVHVGKAVHQLVELSLVKPFERLRDEGKDLVVQEISKVADTVSISDTFYFLLLEGVYLAAFFARLSAIFSL